MPAIGKMQPAQGTLFNPFAGGYRRRPRSNKETPIMAAVRETLERHPFVAKIYRNNNFSRKFEAGETSQNSKAKFISAGLGKGTSDLIGATVTGLFLAVEVKSDDGAETPEQFQFRDLVNFIGGIAIVVRSPMEAWKAIDAIAKKTPDLAAKIGRFQVWRMAQKPVKKKAKAAGSRPKKGARK